MIFLPAIAQKKTCDRLFCLFSQPLSYFVTDLTQKILSIFRRPPGVLRPALTLHPNRFTRAKKGQTKMAAKLLFALSSALLFALAAAFSPADVCFYYLYPLEGFWASSMNGNISVRLDATVPVSEGSHIAVSPAANLFLYSTNAGINKASFSGPAELFISMPASDAYMSPMAIDTTSGLLLYTVLESVPTWSYFRHFYVGEAYRSSPAAARRYGSSAACSYQHHQHRLPVSRHCSPDRAKRQVFDRNCSG